MNTAAGISRTPSGRVREPLPGHRFVMDAACRSSASLYFIRRYPFYQVDAEGKMAPPDCSAVALCIADLKARPTVQSV